ncbi:hypothetical protein SKAU_G00255510 [Synaphobranchus kaupii]|uniref:Uncharacterized protein n=1 Tax=Synaphobranchus kaupii TaxID=118154 RepID=A0A9Q1IRC9_SYNKA|nr:hypothetical protein SKAU_G00255510 [Synaphobranchus kaupii]
MWGGIYFNQKEYLAVRALLHSPALPSRPAPGLGGLARSASSPADVRLFCGRALVPLFRAECGGELVERRETSPHPLLFSWPARRWGRAVPARRGEAGWGDTEAE